MQNNFTSHIYIIYLFMFVNQFYKHSLKNSYNTVREKFYFRSVKANK